MEAGTHVPRRTCGQSPSTCAQRGLERVEPVGQVAVLDRDRRQQPDHVAVEPAREQQQPALTRGGDHGGGQLRLRRAVRDELEREHRAEAAHVADAFELAGEALQPRADLAAERLGAGAERRRRDRVEHDRRGGAGDRVAAERAAQPARPDGVHQLGPPGHRGEREPAAQRLARDEQVGRDAVVLDRPHRPGAPDAGLDLVVDVEDPVRGAQLLQPPREVERHRDEAALALHRLEHDAGHGRGVDLGLEEAPQPVERLVGADAAELVGRRRAVDLGRERAEPALVRRDLAGQRHRQQRAPVERALERDHRRAAGRRARDLDRVLDALGARVQQHALVLAAAGIELRQPPADLDVGLVHADHEALVQVAVDLRVDRLDDRRRAVPEVLAADAAGEVDEGAPVVRLDAGAGSARDDERRRRHCGGDVAVARLADAGKSGCGHARKAGAAGAGGQLSRRRIRAREFVSWTAATPHQSAMNSAIACAVLVTDGRWTRSSTPCSFSAIGPKQTAGVSP